MKNILGVLDLCADASAPSLPLQSVCVSSSFVHCERWGGGGGDSNSLDGLFVKRHC
jgi:hypothetical protein